MIFKNLRIANWRQFRAVDLNFHERLTVLTGANGAGKTTVLNLLSRHFGWNATLVGTPRRRGTGLSFSSGFWTEDSLRDYLAWLDGKSDSRDEPTVPEPMGPQQEIGFLEYANGQSTRLMVPSVLPGAQFEVLMPGLQQQKGVHIPSHRPIYFYQPVQHIPAIPRGRDQAFAAYANVIRNLYGGAVHHHPPNYYMKETLVALAAFGYGNEVIDRNEESLEMFQGFENVLKIVLPHSLGFERLSIRLPEVVVITRSGDFSLDAVSGGIASLIDLAWQVFMCATPGTPFAVTLDEPENHLHPELQRTVLSTFLSAFPQVQFICSTHNPFIVTSVPDSTTYVFRYGDDHKVIAESLTSLDRSGSSNEILRDVLGLPSSSPTWVEQSLREAAEFLANKDLTPQSVEELQTRLKAEGLERFFPATLAKLAKERLS